MRFAKIAPEPGQRLLDVGCGNGAAAIKLAQEFDLEVVGVDVDPEQITAAEAGAHPCPGVRFLVADASRLPFATGEFDLVYTNKTTHHVPDWPNAIAEMGRVLKPGGHLVYSDFVAPGGRRFPTRRGIISTAESQGLEQTQNSRSPFHYTAYFRKRD